MNEAPINTGLKNIFLEALILSALALTVGFSMNYQLVMDAFSGKTIAATQAKHQPVKSAQLVVAYPELVELEEIDELLADGALLVDARNKEEFKAGHLPGSSSLALDSFDSAFSSFKIKVPLQQTLILYCNGFGCPDSFDLGVRLIAEGYQQVRVYEGGFPEWRDAGRSLEVGE